MLARGWGGRAVWIALRVAVELAEEAEKSEEWIWRGRGIGIWGKGWVKLERRGALIRRAPMRRTEGVGRGGRNEVRVMGEGSRMGE